MKITIRRGRKIGDPGYSSTDVGLELEVECPDDMYFDKPDEFSAWMEVNWKAADELLESEIKRIYAARPAPVVTAAQRDERRPEPATSRPAYQNGDGRSNGNGYHDEGEREIERARSREELRDDRPFGTAIGDQGYRNGDGAATRPRYDWNQRGDRPPDRDERDRPRNDRGGRRGGGRNGNGGEYGPPKTGRQLFAWAKRQEENGAEGFLKALQRRCKDMTGDGRFDNLDERDVPDVYRAARAMLEEAGGGY